jgi:HEAT repeat protein
MSPPGDDRASRRARAAHPDEETRYRAVGELDAADGADRALLVERLADPSWRVRAAAVERLAPPAGRVALPGLLAVLDAGPGAGAREAAAAALARIGEDALPALLERLAAGDGDLRQAAAGVLGEVGDRRAVPALAARLSDPDANVRAAAADALGKLGGPDAVSALRAAVASGDVGLRLSALEALGTLRAPLPAAEIERLLADRPLRRSLFRMLGTSDEPEALAVIARGAADPSRAGRTAALGALGQQRARRGGAELAGVAGALREAAARDPSLADAWAAALDGDEPDLAAGALVALGAAGAARHAGAIARLAEDERHRAAVEEALDGIADGPELRAALADALPELGSLARITVLAALARAGSDSALEAVIREASDPASYVQAEAIAALGRVRDTAGVAPLAGLLADPGHGAAGLAAAALVGIGQSGPRARDAVLAATRDRAAVAGGAACFRVLGALGGAEDVAAVEAGLGGPQADGRAAAAAALGALARRGLVPAGRVPALLAACFDPAWAVRAAAARALADVAGCRPGGRADDEEVVVLRRALADAEGAVRAAAAEALGACGGPRDALAVAALVTEENAPAVVIAALHALARLGPVPVEVLRSAASQGDPEVVKEAVLAAARVAGEDGERLLRDAAASPRWDVRRVAARALAERGEPALRAFAERHAAEDPDPLVARAFADAARALGGR